MHINTSPEYLLTTLTTVNEFLVSQGIRKISNIVYNPEVDEIIVDEDVVHIRSVEDVEAIVFLTGPRSTPYEKLEAYTVWVDALPDGEAPDKEIVIATVRSATQAPKRREAELLNRHPHMVAGTLSYIQPDGSCLNPEVPAELRLDPRWLIFSWISPLHGSRRHGRWLKADTVAGIKQLIRNTICK